MKNLKKTPQTPPPRRLRRLDFRVFCARPATPNVPVALTPMPMRLPPRKKPGMDDENPSYATVVDLI